jgi:bisphosphoglycerate-independent phosphoglycerate mutase (AlkP superfamily)
LEAFNRILNEKRSGIPVTAAFGTIAGKTLTTQQQLLNRMLCNSYKPWGAAECLDVFTHYAAMAFLKSSKPKVLYIAYGETDAWAHAGQYRGYLNAARQVDAWLQELWPFVQTTPEYKNRTALLITVDHGRGLGDEWTSHGQAIKGADEMWFAVLAPGLPAKGEVTSNMQLYLQQLAQTIANLLGVTYKTDHPVAEGLMQVLK